MKKEEVLKILNDLKKYEKIKFKMFDSNIDYIVSTKYLRNFPDAEMIESSYDNFKCLYCSIVEISPVV